MNNVHRVVIMFALALVFLPVSVLFTGNGGSLNIITVANAQTLSGCSIVNANWKTYGRNVDGADKKVSDVVLNACAALGGGSQCNIIDGYRPPAHNKAVGGAKNSQHMYRRAIDLSVPSGEKKQFITYAICGLQKVNNCSGGIGLYSRGSIHIDVRGSARNVWSDSYHRTSIATKINDPQARNILYGFADRKGCTSSSIVTSNTESNRYGAPITYTPQISSSNNAPTPANNPRNTPKNPLQSILERFFNPTANQKGGTNDVLGNLFTDQQTPATNNGNNPSGQGNGIMSGFSGGSGSGGFFGTSQGGTTMPNRNGFNGLNFLNGNGGGSTNAATCQKISFFGIDLFNSCMSNRTTPAPGSGKQTKIGTGTQIPTTSTTTVASSTNNPSFSVTRDIFKHGPDGSNDSQSTNSTYHNTKSRTQSNSSAFDKGSTFTNNTTSDKNGTTVKTRPNILDNIIMGIKVRVVKVRIKNAWDTAMTKYVYPAMNYVSDLAKKADAFIYGNGKNAH